MLGLKRFYYSGSFEKQLKLTDDVFKHLKVMRFSKKDLVVLQNEQYIGKYEILQIDRHFSLLNLLEIKNTKLPNYKLKGYISLLKREYMDSVVEKVSEIGVTDIFLIKTTRSIRKINVETIDRFKKLAAKGALQSEQDFIPKIYEPQELIDITEDCEDKILFWERGLNKNLALTSTNVAFFIGPEGGLTDEEVDILRDKGFKPCTPFNNVLKAETAATVFAGMLRGEIERFVS
jgi:16S rRNA (uracil1498-N3)-methyltransferase